jgi:hypothetical protein
MKKNLIFLVLFFITAVSCNNKNHEDETPPPVVQQPAPAPEHRKPDGTTVKVGDEGMSVENKDHGKEHNIELSKDSASIEIRKPK